MGFEAIDLYREMPENLRDDITHICILSACSHSGLADQARAIFSQIERKTEKVITTMVSFALIWRAIDVLDWLSVPYLLLWRSTTIDRAIRTLQSSKQCHVQYVRDCLTSTEAVDLKTVLVTILSAARNQCDAVLSRELYQRMQLLFPEHKSGLISASILLSNTYISVGDEQQAAQIRTDRIQRLGDNVRAGCAWTEVNGELVVNQRSKSIESFEDSSRNSMPMIDLIRDPTRSMLKWID